MRILEITSLKKVKRRKQVLYSYKSTCLGLQKRVGKVILKTLQYVKVDPVFQINANFQNRFDLWTRRLYNVPVSSVENVLHPSSHFCFSLLYKTNIKEVQGGWKRNAKEMFL